MTMTWSEDGGARIAPSSAVRSRRMAVAALSHTTSLADRREGLLSRLVVRRTKALWSHRTHYLSRIGATTQASKRCPKGAGGASLAAL